MQAAQSSTLRRVRSFSARPLTMSAIASRPPGRRTRAASAKTRCLTGERLIDSVRDDDVEGGVLEGESVDARLEELDLCEPVAISQPGRLGDLLVGEVDSDHPSGGADLEGGAERICSGARAEVEHPVSGCERGEVEVVADAGERRQGLGGDRVEELAWVAKSQRELPPDREVELCFLLPRYLAIHVLHLRLEHLTVDEGAGVRLRQRRRQSHLVLGGDPIRTHLDLLPGRCWPRKSNSVRLSSYVSRAAARREVAGIRPEFWPRGQLRESYSSELSEAAI